MTCSWVTLLSFFFSQATCVLQLSQPTCSCTQLLGHSIHFFSLSTVLGSMRCLIGWSTLALMTCAAMLHAASHFLMAPYFYARGHD